MGLRLLPSRAASRVTRVSRRRGESIMSLWWWNIGIHVSQASGYLGQDANYFVKPQRKYWANGPYDRREKAYAAAGDYLYWTTSRSWHQALQEFWALEKAGHIGLPRRVYNEYLEASGTSEAFWDGVTKHSIDYPAPPDVEPWDENVLAQALSDQAEVRQKRGEEKAKRVKEASKLRPTAALALAGVYALIGLAIFGIVRLIGR